MKSLQGKLKFIRHHIFGNKKSINVNDLVISTKALHNAIEGKGKLISTLIDQLLDWKNSKCPDYYRQMNSKDWKDK